MDEDLDIINKKTRNERIKNFILENKKKLIFIFLIILSITLIFFGYKEFANKKKTSDVEKIQNLTKKFKQKNKKSKNELQSSKKIQTWLKKS